MESSQKELEYRERLCDELNSLYYLAVCDNEEAAAKIRLLAEKTSKDPIAIAFYALILFYGYGVPIDEEKARLLASVTLQSLEDTLSELNSTSIKVIQCMHYLIGKFRFKNLFDLKCDIVACLDHLTRSADLGYAPALNDLAFIYYCNNFCQTLRILRQFIFAKAKLSATAGYPLAYVILGFFYQIGFHVKRDAETAFYYYCKGAKLGVIGAEKGVGLAYLHGLGTDQNVSKGLTWLRKAANKHCIQTLYELGRFHFLDTDSCYTADEVNLRNLEEGLKWYNMAAEQNHVPSLTSLGYFYLLGEYSTVVPKDEVKALELFHRDAKEDVEQEDIYLDEKAFQAACAHNHQYLMKHCLVTQRNRAKVIKFGNIRAKV